MIVAAFFASLLVSAQGNPADDKIYDQVRLKITENPDVNGGGIEVVVKDGAVTLKGSVQRDKQKQKAGQVAKKVKGVRSVDNQLTVEVGATKLPTRPK